MDAAAGLLGLEEKIAEQISYRYGSLSLSTCSNGGIFDMTILVLVFFI